MTATRTARPMTPVTTTSARNLRNGRQEIWDAVSTDGLWAYERTEDAGTPWQVTYRPTGRWAYAASLPSARRWTARLAATVAGDPAGLAQLTAEWGL